MTERYANRSARGRAPTADDEMLSEKALRDRLTNTASRDRHDAALALVDRAADDKGLSSPTVAALVERIQEDTDSDVRQFAVEALGVTGTGRETLAAALSDPNQWVRAEAIVALSRAYGSAATEHLHEGLDDTSGPVRRNSLIALGKLDALETTSLRTRLKEDPFPAVREYAAEYLGSNPGDITEAVTLLAAVLARDPNAFVRASAAGSLGDLGSDRAIEALETQGVEDRSDDVRRAAERALAVARGEDPDAVDHNQPPAPGGGPQRPTDSPAMDQSRSNRGSPSGSGNSDPVNGRQMSNNPPGAESQDDTVPPDAHNGGDRL